MQDMKPGYLAVSWQQLIHMHEQAFVKPTNLNIM